MNNQNVEPATSKSDIVLVTLAVLCAVAGVIAFSLLTSQTLAVRLGALFGGLVAIFLFLCDKLIEWGLYDGLLRLSL